MTDRELFETAKEARRRAYAPYSGFAVGAALLSSRGSVYLGSNVENASYPMGMCAERTAFFKAISEGEREFLKIAIAGGPADREILANCPPCGACRQVMREFCGPDFLVLFSDGNGSYHSARLGELLPESFGPDRLGR